MNIKNYKVIKKLGQGITGVVYKIQLTDNKLYALKLEKITETELNNKNSKIWREINFYDNFGNNYPEYFTQLIGYYFENKNMISYDKLDIKISVVDYTEFDDVYQQYFNEHKNSNLYIYKIYDLIDGTIDEIIMNLNRKQIYSMIIQITNIIKLLHRNNYVHGDIHAENIGFCKTSNKVININGIDIDTYGYVYKLIDLSFVLHKNQLITEYEINKYNILYKNEYMNIINCLLLNNDFFIKLKYWNYIENKKNNQIIDNNYLYLCDNKLIITNTNIDDDIKYINLCTYYLENDKITSFVSKNDIYYILQHKNDYDNILSHFINKIIDSKSSDFVTLCCEKLILIIIVLIILYHII